MRKILLTLFVLALTIPLSAQAPGGSAGDDAAIRRVLQQHDDARNRGDWKALGELFTEDAEQRTSSGEWRKGRAAIQQGVERVMMTTYKGGKYTTTIEAIRTITPGVAIVDGGFEIANIGAAGSRRGNTTYVMVKSGSEWRVAATRSMVPAPVGPTAAPKISR